MTASPLHVVHGRSGAGSLRQALGCPPRELLVQHDPLTVGPLPRVGDLSEWNEVRDAFWKRMYGDEPVMEGARDLAKNASSLRTTRSICVWVGTGATDQLLLPWLAQVFRWEALSLEMSVIQFDLLPGPRPMEAIGFGMVSPENIRQHPPAQVVSPDGIAELERVWTALTAPRPDEVLRMIAAGAGGFPFLHRALRTGLDRLPDRRSGLAHWDVELLKHTRSAGPSVVKVLGDTLRAAVHTHYPDAIGDGTLFDRLRRLGDADLPHPAVTIEAGDHSSYKGWQVRLTDAGEAFLASERNFVEQNGIDEWVAGVHLDSRTGSVWYRDGDAVVAAKSRAE